MESRAEGRIKSEEIRANKIMTKKTVIEGVDCRGGGKKERRERQMTEQSIFPTAHLAESRVCTL